MYFKSKFYCMAMISFSTETPCFPQDWYWNNQGASQQCSCQQHSVYSPQGYRKDFIETPECDSCECVSIHPSQHEDIWKNNFLCAKKTQFSPKLEFSKSGQCICFYALLHVCKIQNKKNQNKAVSSAIHGFTKVVSSLFWSNEGKLLIQARKARSETSW